MDNTEEKVVQNDRFPSIYLEELGIHNMFQFYEILQENDINLGKIDVSKLSAKQLNSLLKLNMSFKNYDCFSYIDNDSNLIVTTDYRDQDISRDTKFRNGWVTMHIDFIFGKINGSQEKK